MRAGSFTSTFAPLLLVFSFQTCPQISEPGQPLSRTTGESLLEHCNSIEEKKDFHRVYVVPKDAWEELSDEELLEKATAGDAGAQCRLGRKLNLFGRARDWQKWLEAAAAQGNLDAHYILGVILHKRGDKDGINWLEEAAAKGDGDALYKLGRIYYLGQQTSKDHDLALKHFRKLAEGGDPDGQFHLGVMFYRGEAVPQDFVLAHSWINLAASRTSGDAAARAKRLRDRVAEEMTREQIAEAQKLARQWKPK
jgi:TPR repeat protein